MQHPIDSTIVENITLNTTSVPLEEPNCTQRDLDSTTEESKLAQIRKELDESLTMDALGALTPATISPEQFEEIKTYALDNSVTSENLAQPHSSGVNECEFVLNKLRRPFCLGTTENKAHLFWSKLMLCIVTLQFTITIGGVCYLISQCIRSLL